MCQDPFSECVVDRYYSQQHVTMSSFYKFRKIETKVLIRRSMFQQPGGLFVIVFTDSKVFCVFPLYAHCTFAEAL